MKNQYFLAIDIGASSGRHILGHLENGRLQIEEIYRFRNSLIVKNGHLIWNVDRLYHEIIAGLKEAGRLQKFPTFIGIDTWAVDYVLLNKNDQALGDVFGYRDARTSKAIAEVGKIVSFPSLYEKTGIQFQPFNTVFQLYADKMSGKIEDATSLLMLPDYFSFLLTGVKKQEYTNATTTGLVNALSHQFDDSLFERLGLTKGLFAPMAQPGTLLGPLKKDVAAEIGYQTQVMLPCTHDTASAVLALPSFEPAPYISSGTWSLLGIESSFPRFDEESRLANFTNEGSVHQRFRYQKNIIGLWMIQRLKKETKDQYDFAELTDLARASPIALTIDVNDERFLSPKSMSAEVQEAVGSSLSIAQIAYCVFHSLALSYAASLERLEKATGTKYGELHIIGGGSQNSFLNELTAQATNKKVIAGPIECTAIGNIVAQMSGSGLLKDEKACKQLILDSFDIKEVKV